MAINSNRMIVGMGTVLATDSTGDLQLAFSSSQMAKSWYFASAPIKIGAKYKPFIHTTVAFSDQSSRDTARAGVNYGVSIPDCQSSALLDTDWSVARPDGSTSQPRRSLDFEKYYLDAPDVPVCCMFSGVISINPININSATMIPFFIYQKTGVIADRAPDTTNGVSSTAVGRNSTQIEACLDLSELNAQGGAVITSLTNPYLGFSIYQGTTFKGFFGCRSKLLASQTTGDIDMYHFHTADITGLAAGDYTAMACIRYGSSNSYKFIPMPTGTAGTYQNKYTMKIGGADLYTYKRKGLSKTNTASSTTSLTTTGPGVYITINVTNNTGIVHDSNNTNSSGWILNATLTGSYVQNGVTKSVNRTTGNLGMQNFYPGTSQYLTIPKDGNVDITFFIPNIWTTDGSTPTSGVTSGSLAVTAVLKYVSGGSSQNFTAASSQPSLLITYG